MIINLCINFSESDSDLAMYIPGVKFFVLIILVLFSFIVTSCIILPATLHNTNAAEILDKFSTNKPSSVFKIRNLAF